MSNQNIQGAPKHRLKQNNQIQNEKKLQRKISKKRHIKATRGQEINIWHYWSPRKITVWCHITTIRMPSIKKTDNNKYWWGSWGKGILIHCWLEWKFAAFKKNYMSSFFSFNLRQNYCKIPYLTLEFVSKGSIFKRSEDI